MTELALTGMIDIVQNVNVDAARELFHLASEDYKAEVFENLPGGEDGNDYGKVVDGVGVISIDGPIVPRSRSLTKVSGMNSISSLTKEFKSMSADESVKEILLLVDSPGGAVTGVSEFSQLIKGSKKKVTSYVYGMAASAAYWIASSADKIISSNTGQVGSIGVIATVKKSKDDNKIEIVSSNAKNKSPDVETDEGKEQYLQMVNDLEKVFIGTVAGNRGVQIETVKKDFGQGGILIAENALEAGMIDGISTLDDVLDNMKTGTQGSFDFQINGCAATDNQAFEIDATNKQGAKKMNIDELRSSSPEFAAEYEKRLQEAVALGKKDGEKAVMDRIKLAVSVLDSDYPQTIKGFAMDVITGKEDPLSLKGAVTGYDAMKSKELAAAAVADTDAVGDTPAQKIAGPSADGVVRTEEDFNACVESLRAR